MGERREMETALYSGFLFFVILLFTFKRLLKPRRSHPNYPPSGPLCLPIIGQLHLLKPPLHQTLAGLSTRYGNILLLRFGSRRVLVVSCPSAVEECLTKNDITFANRPSLLSGKYFSYDYTTLADASYGPLWRNLRRVTALEVFSSRRISAMSGIRAEEVRLLLRQLFRSAEAAGGDFQRIEMKTWFSKLAFNAMTQMILGKRYFEDGGTEAHAEGDRLRRIIEEVFYLSEGSSIEDFLPFMRWFGLNKLEKQMVRVAEEMDEVLQDMIERRRRLRSSDLDEERKGKDSKTTILDGLLALQDTEPEYFTDVLIKGIILVIIAGGTDTSSGTMEWAMALLLNHPEALKKARAEIDMHVAHERLLADSDLPNLHYLHNVIKETLRLYPAAPLLLPHESSSECKVGGFDVPRGTMLFVNAYALSRDPTLWTDPTKFNPDRFDNGEGEGSSYIPFGSGRRRCPGEYLATRFMGLALGALIQCFEWERVGQEDVDFTEGVAFTLHKANPLVVLYKPRQNMAATLSRL